MKPQIFLLCCALSLGVSGVCAMDEIGSPASKHVKLRCPTGKEVCQELAETFECIMPIDSIIGDPLTVNNQEWQVRSITEPADMEDLKTLRLEEIIVGNGVEHRTEDGTVHAYISCLYKSEKKSPVWLMHHVSSDQGKLKLSTCSFPNPQHQGQVKQKDPHLVHFLLSGIGADEPVELSCAHESAE